MFDENPTRVFIPRVCLIKGLWSAKDGIMQCTVAETLIALNATEHIYNLQPEAEYRKPENVLWHGLWTKARCNFDE